MKIRCIDVSDFFSVLRFRREIMCSTNDVLKYAMSTFCGKDVNICLIDFFHCSDVSSPMRKKHE